MVAVGIFVLPSATEASAKQVNSCLKDEQRISVLPRLVSSAVEQNLHNCTTSVSKLPCTMLVER